MGRRVALRPGCQSLFEDGARLCLAVDAAGVQLGLQRRHQVGAAKAARVTLGGYYRQDKLGVVARLARALLALLSRKLMGVLPPCARWRVLTAGHAGENRFYCRGRVAALPESPENPPSAFWWARSQVNASGAPALAGATFHTINVSSRKAKSAVSSFVSPLS